MKLNLTVTPDEDAVNPRTWDNLGTMLCFHRRYNLGDENELKSENFRGWNHILDHLKKELGAVIVLPLYLLDHSGITISTTSFNDVWDSGQVGFIYVSREKLLKEYRKTRVTARLLALARSALESEVVIYDHHITGDVWSYFIRDERGNILDDAHGFLGRDEAQAAGELDQLEILQTEEARLALLEEMQFFGDGALSGL
jgi:hypothetical protein